MRINKKQAYSVPKLVNKFLSILNFSNTPATWLTEWVWLKITWMVSCMKLFGNKSVARFLWNKQVSVQ